MKVCTVRDRFNISRYHESMNILARETDYCVRLIRVQNRYKSIRHLARTYQCHRYFYLPITRFTSVQKRGQVERERGSGLSIKRPAPTARVGNGVLSR